MICIGHKKFVDNYDGTAFNTLTKLMWTTSDFRNIEGRPPDSWFEIIHWLAKINRQKYCGYSDWRIPNIIEYLTSFDYNMPKVGYDNDSVGYSCVFKDKGGFCCWSNEDESLWNNLKGSKAAKYFSFYSGSDSWYNKIEDKNNKRQYFSVRLVRGGRFLLRPMGNYVEKSLSDDEYVVYWAKVHWINSYSFRGVLSCLRIPELETISSEIAITNKKIVLKIGFLSIKIFEMKIKSIESIIIEQGFLGRLLNYGNIRIIGIGGTEQLIKNISKPIEFQKQIHATINRDGSRNNSNFNSDYGHDNERKSNSSKNAKDDTEYHFSILELKQGASFEEIKNAYKKKMKEYHPDKVANLGKELRELAEKKAKEINDAYEKLMKKYLKNT